jgi:hypothetical protein
MASVFNEDDEKIGQRLKYNNKYFYVFDIEIEAGVTETDAPDGSFAWSKIGDSLATVFFANGGIWDSYDIPGTAIVKASGVEVNTGTDNTKLITAKALADSEYVKESDLSGNFTEENLTDLVAGLTPGTLDPSAEFLALQNDIVVSGAGTESVNSLTGYTYSGQHNGESYWNLEGTDPLVSSIVYGEVAGNRLGVYDGDGVNVYFGNANIADPLTAEWSTSGDGAAPAPTVTAVPSLKSVLPWQIVNRGSVSHTDSDNALTVTNEDCGKIFDNAGAGDPVTFLLDDANFDDGWFVTFQIVADNTVNINRGGTHNIYGQFVFWTGVIADLRELNTCCIASGSLAATITLRKSGGKLNVIAVTGNWFDND